MDDAEADVRGAAPPQCPEPNWLAAVAEEEVYAWALTAWRRAQEVPGAWFDAAKADAAVRMWPQVFRLTEDRFAGKPFRLNRWQEIIVRLLVGWKVPVEVLDEETGLPRMEHVRLFRQLLLWVPRKNGKSEFLSALALLFFVLDGAVGGQGYAFARDEKQGKVVFDKMKAMIALSPPLAGRVTPFKKSIWIPQIRSTFELLSGKPEGKHGRSPTVIAGDEMHEWISTELADTLRQGTGARLQPIELYASTAGVRANEVGYGLWEKSLAILDGRIDDPSTLVVLFAAGKDDDWTDEAVWRRANPSLGLSPTIDFLRREAKAAKDNPRAEAYFKCYHLNQWIDAVVRWLDPKAWARCAKDTKAWKVWGADRSLFRGRRCFGAFDVSSTKDVTALIWAFPPDEDHPVWQVLCDFWVPEDTLAARVKNDGLPYDQWAAAGALTPTPGNVVDQNYLKRAILAGIEEFGVEAIAYDPWNSTKLLTDLQEEGADANLFREMRQGIPTLGEPTKHFERLVMAGELDHGGHPVLKWMAGNAVVRFDDNLNYCVAKKKSREKIDGIAAGVMAVGLAMTQEVEGPSVYEGRGIIEIEV